MVLAIGFSRVALAAHYVSDVVAAYLLGLAWVAVMAALSQIWRHRTPFTQTSEPGPQAAKGAHPA